MSEVLVAAEAPLRTAFHDEMTLGEQSCSGAARQAFTADNLLLELELQSHGG